MGGARVRRSAMRTRLALWRAHRGYSQAQLAAHSGVPLGTLRRIEQGCQQGPPDIRHLQNLRLVLGCQLEDLLEDAWRGWTAYPDGPDVPPTGDGWAAQRNARPVAEPGWTSTSAAVIKPVSSVARGPKPFFTADLGRTFDRRLVSALVGMAPGYVSRALGTRARRVTLAQVLSLLELDAFAETFVPRSRIPDYLLQHGDSVNHDVDWSLVDAPLTLRAAEARRVIRQLPAGSVQCVVTSPPYWATRVYREQLAVSWADGETAPYGHEQTPEGFIRHTAELLHVLRPAIAQRGSVWLVLMDTYNTRTAIRANSAEVLRAMGGSGERWGEHAARRYSSGHSFLKDGEQCLIPWRVAESATRLGYYVRTIITWRKPSVRPEPVTTRVTRVVEYVLHLTLDRAPLFHSSAYLSTPSDLGGRDPRYEPEKLTDVWTLPASSGNGGHGAQFPLALPARCIALTSDPDDLVLDPFLGIGQTALAALRLQRRCLGTDASTTYLETARRRHTQLAVAASKRTVR